MKVYLPQNVKYIINKLQSGGYEAYAVGGCIRDSLLGLAPHDWDICTNAKPEQIKACFSGFHIFDIGIKHGTISVVIDKEAFEITTYRIDGEYNDNRHPDKVTFTKSVADDLARRDFTINAIAYNETNGIVDPFDGRGDIKSGIIRCVGNPDTRFNEDALRILRALRFASVYNLKIEENTANAVINNAPLLKNIAGERIASELDRLLCGKNVENVLNGFSTVFSVILPEIEITFNYNQHTKHHDKDLWCHITSSVAAVEPTALLRMTMLLHDLGKPYICKRDSDGTCHFKGHPNISAKTADIILHRLKYPTDFINTCLKLIKFHDVRFSGAKKQLKHVMNAIGEDDLDLLLKVQRADILAQSAYLREEKLERLDIACNAYREILADNEAFKLKDLAVNGNDLKNIGIAEGREIGRILKLLMSLVIDEKLPNEKSALLSRAAESVRTLKPDK
ncbi:MAG: HD domain-containing protein [Clostridiales bacterium]|nr:HD domain-containing protein [Clostridiales bacterium]